MLVPSISTLPRRSYLRAGREDDDRSSEKKITLEGGDYEVTEKELSMSTFFTHYAVEAHSCSCRGVPNITEIQILMANYLETILLHLPSLSQFSCG